MLYKKEIVIVMSTFSCKSQNLSCSWMCG